MYHSTIFDCSDENVTVAVDPIYRAFTGEKFRNRIIIEQEVSNRTREALFLTLSNAQEAELRDKLMESNPPAGDAVTARKEAAQARQEKEELVAAVREVLNMLDARIVTLNAARNDDEDNTLAYRAECELKHEVYVAARDLLREGTRKQLG